MGWIITLIAIALAAFTWALCRWGESGPSELNAADRYQTTADLEKQLRENNRLKNTTDENTNHFATR